MIYPLPRKKFIRRADLSDTIRFHIALQAYLFKGGVCWGKITELARQYLISRTFVYLLSRELEKNIPLMFGAISHHAPVIEQNLSLQNILSLRLEGRCSIQAISTIMKRFNIKPSSTGHISQILENIGSLLPSTQSIEDDDVRMVVFLSDEIFSKRTPILVTVEPISSAILNIELAETRKIEVWKKHWLCLENNRFQAVYLVCDEGSSLCAAQKEALPKIKRQPDTYHAIAHKLGKWVNILENAAYSAIETEDHCERILNSARSDRVINDRIQKCELASQRVSEKIDQYENFRFLYRSLIKNLDLFDDNGDLRERTAADENIPVALDLLETLGIDKITQTVKTIRNTMPDLLNYFDQAKSILDGLKNSCIEPKALQAFCLAWQWRKKLIKAKHAQRRKRCKENERFYLELAESLLQDEEVNWKDTIYAELDKIIQSSSLVECINSIIRPYLNTTKNHVTQEMLNLIMFYHNHRRYKDGKRVNKTPMEILTGREQDKDWIELIFDEVKKNDPTCSILQT